MEETNRILREELRRQTRFVRIMNVAGIMVVIVLGIVILVRPAIMQRINNSRRQIECSWSVAADAIDTSDLEKALQMSRGFSDEYPYDWPGYAVPDNLYISFGDKKTAISSFARGYKLYPQNDQ